MSLLFQKYLMEHAFELAVLGACLANIAIALLQYRRLGTRTHLSLRILHTVLKYIRKTEGEIVGIGSKMNQNAEIQMKIHNHQRAMLASLLQQASRIEAMLGEAKSGHDAAPVPGGSAANPVSNVRQITGFRKPVQVSNPSVRRLSDLLLEKNEVPSPQVRSTPVSPVEAVGQNWAKFEEELSAETTRIMKVVADG